MKSLPESFLKSICCNKCKGAYEVFDLDFKDLPKRDREFLIMCEARYFVGVVCSFCKTSGFHIVKRNRNKKEA